MEQASRLTYRTVWPQIGAEDAERIVAFWMMHGALPEEHQARARVDQVVMYACDDRGEIVAVCTAFPQTPAQLGQPVYFYRSFVAPAWRGTLLAFRLLRQALAVLEAHARDHDWPCVGILLEMENQIFGRKGRMPVWPVVDFVYVGRSPRGLECRVHWFRQAQLKPPAAG